MERTKQIIQVARCFNPSICTETKSIIFIIHHSYHASATIHVNPAISVKRSGPFLQGEAVF